MLASFPAVVTGVPKTYASMNTFPVVLSTEYVKTSNNPPSTTFITSK